MVVTCPKCGTVINRKEWDEVKNKWKEGKFYKIIDPKLTDLKKGQVIHEDNLEKYLEQMEWNEYTAFTYEEHHE